MNFTSNELSVFVDFIRESRSDIRSDALVQEFVSRKTTVEKLNDTNIVFTGLAAFAVAQMERGLLVSHNDRIVATYRAFENPTVAMAYLNICAKWRSKKYGISIEDARKIEFDMAMEYAERYGDKAEMQLLLTNEVVA